MGDDEEYLRSLPTVDVTAVDISPNPALLTDELNLEVDFHLSKPVANGVWDIEVRTVHVSIHARSLFLSTRCQCVCVCCGLQYLVDSVTKRHIINILLTSRVLAACILTTIYTLAARNVYANVGAP